MKIVLAMITFFASFLLAADEKLLPNGINPEVNDINTTWGLILFFMWPVLIFISYKFVEFTLRKIGEDI